MGPRAGLDAMAKRERPYHYPCWKLDPGRPLCNLVPILTELTRPPVWKMHSDFSDDSIFPTPTP
jgi:hypothetical protein